MTGAWCAAAALAAGPVVGVLWWVLAPGGRSVVTGALPTLQAPGSQDAWFATLAAAAGLVVAIVWVGGRPAVPDATSARCLMAALAGSLAGAAAAWAVGLALDAVIRSTPPSGASPTVTELGLASPAAILVWPFVVALVVAADTARDLLASGFRRGRPGGWIS
ncbi:MAG: hypothetical protein ACFCVF_00675 [Kineosporiaceae bacterium]